MSLVGLLLLIVIGGICGALAQLVVGFTAGGFIASVVIGFLGAVLGTWIAGVVGLPSLLAVRVEGYSIEILWSILGAIVLLAVLSFVRRASYRRPYV
jgi:uncharacterized membrane protein YeaQ/YmgE (transglycosylase-associated protein family)